MSIRSVITGTKDRREAEVEKQRDLPGGLVSYTQPLRRFFYDPKAALNPVNGRDMAVDATFSGTPDLIHNGGDSSGWTATAVSGTWDFTSTDQAFTGTQSVDATATVNNDTALFTRSTPIDASNYEAVSLALYISFFDDKATKNIRFQFRLAGANVGDEILLRDFADFTNTGVWIQLGINLSDFNVEGNVDELAVTNIDVGAGQPIDFYLDAIQLEETSGISTYTISPSSGELVEIKTLEIVIANNVASTVTDGTAPGLSYNSLLGITITSPVIIRYIRREVVQFTFNVFTIGDLLAIPGMILETVISDGTNTFCKFVLEFRDYVVIEDKFDDRFELIINDDFSSLLEFQVTGRGNRLVDPNTF